MTSSFSSALFFLELQDGPLLIDHVILQEKAETRLKFQLRHNAHRTTQTNAPCQSLSTILEVKLQIQAMTLPGLVRRFPASKYTI